MTDVVQPIDSTKVVEALASNIKCSIHEFRLDRSSFISGLEFVADAPREPTEGRLIPEVVNASIEVGAERPTQEPIDARPPDNIEELLPENVGLSRDERAIFATAVIVMAISATSKALTLPTATHVITALKEANLMPADRESAVWERAELICQCTREAGANMPQLAAQGEGLTYLERREMILARLSPELRQDEVTQEMEGLSMGGLSI
jgi:hypothetical protein